jgi:hypothetical protein
MTNCTTSGSRIKRKLARITLSTRCARERQNELRYNNSVGGIKLDNDVITKQVYVEQR